MAARQIAEPQPSDPNSDEPFHFVTDFVKHPADLAIEALLQHYSKAGRAELLHAR